MRRRGIALAVTFGFALAGGCGGHTQSYRGVRFGQMLGGIASHGAEFRAFTADRSAQIHGRFNESSCAECHGVPATGGSQFLRSDFVIKQGSARSAVTFARYALTGGVVRFRTPSGRFYVRRPPALYGIGLLAAVPVDQLRRIRNDQLTKSPQHAGRIPELPDGTIGRFGWKAQMPTLGGFVATALRTELGAYSPKDAILVTRFLSVLAAPPPARRADVSQGRALFERIGCADCHRPSVRVGVFAPMPVLSNASIDAYTDLLLHDMGPQNAELRDGAAAPSEFRTPPLWGVASTGPPYLHNGRALSLAQAICFHGGQAVDSSAKFRALTSVQRAALLRFLHSL